VSTAVVAADVGRGLEELEDAFPGRVRHEPDGEGGTFVTIEEIQLSDRWTAPRCELTFHLAYNYPAASIYPYYLPKEVILADGGFPAALQRVEWRGNQVIQVSLRQENWDPRRDNAVGAVMQTQSWLRSQ
jgi:hypothetical protein